MQEAMQALIAHCFEALGTHRIEAEIQPENLRSARSADRLGFQREGSFVGLSSRLATFYLEYGLSRPDWDRSSAR